MSLFGGVATQLANAGSTAADRYIRGEYAAAGWSAGEAGVPVLCAAQGFASIFGSIAARVVAGVAMLRGGAVVLSDGGLVLDGAALVSSGVAVDTAVSGIASGTGPLIGLTTAAMAGDPLADHRVVSVEHIPTTKQLVTLPDEGNILERVQSGVEQVLEKGSFEVRYSDNISGVYVFTVSDKAGNSLGIVQVYVDGKTGELVPAADLLLNAGRSGT